MHGAFASRSIVWLCYTAYGDRRWTRSRTIGRRRRGGTPRRSGWAGRACCSSCASARCRSWSSSSAAGRARRPCHVWHDAAKLTATAGSGLANVSRPSAGGGADELFGGLLAPGSDRRACLSRYRPVPALLQALSVRTLAAPPAEAARLRSAAQEVRPRHAAVRQVRRSPPLRRRQQHGGR
ncbi:hypothetical protein VPH35_121906 [Triticum aestivum]